MLAPDSTVNFSGLSDGFMHPISYSAEKSKINQTRTRGYSELYSTPEKC
jgi:hypothetical protein